jgi:mediator of RNA polymerase II transcription subunit 17
MERSQLKGEKYWVDALRIRRANWGLTPAPLPLGAATGKGADKTSKDFVISYGLEGCKSQFLLSLHVIKLKIDHIAPTLFRRRAVSHLSILGDSSADILFPSHQHTRLRISISTATGAASSISIFDSPVPNFNAQNLDSALKTSQSEIVDQEIFSLLVKEAGNLPTASARVSERLIVIDAAQGLHLTFELVECVSPLSQQQF